MKKTLIKISNFVIFVILFMTNITNAQQDSQYTQYMYNTISVNPAYAGSREMFTVFGLYRTQWVGLDGAPKTGVFSINTPINERVGLGITFVGDRIGVTESNSLSVDFSYNIPVSEDYKLAFGLKGSLNLLSADYNKLNIQDGSDYIFSENINNEITPNAMAGLFLYSNKFYVGLSFSNLIENEFYLENNRLHSTKERLHSYLISGYVFDVSDNIKFKPATMVKLVEGSPLQVDVSGNFLFNDVFTFGVAWRWDAAVSGLAGFQVNDNWFIGYTYDGDTTRLSKHNSGSHEIFLRYEFTKKRGRIITPRFF